MANKKKKKAVVNFKKIKRDLIIRDTNGDNRFRTQTVVEKKHKPEKYKKKYLED